MWTRDLRLKLWLIGVTGFSAFTLLLIHGMRFDFRSAVTPAATVVLLTPFAIVFHQRNIDAFANLLTGFLCMVGFNFFLTILTYAVAPAAMPLADNLLMQIDAGMGVHLPAIVAAVKQRPLLQQLLNLAYYSVLPSTLLALVINGLSQNTVRLREFVLTFMIAGLVTTSVFAVLPAEGPFAAYGYQPRADQLRFLHHFRALRAGTFREVSLFRLEGLITFPSFHTAWAVLVAWSFRHYRWLFPPMLLLNACVIASTMTTGWHYAADVAGGLLTAALAIAIAVPATRRLNSPVDTLVSGTTSLLPHRRPVAQESAGAG